MKITELFSLHPSRCRQIDSRIKMVAPLASSSILETFRYQMQSLPRGIVGYISYTLRSHASLEESAHRVSQKVTYYTL